MEMVVMNRESCLQEENTYEQMAISLSIPAVVAQANF